MKTYLCVTCGIEHDGPEGPPVACPVCEDERQYVGHDGQQWTTPDELKARHRNVVTELEPGLYQIITKPQFAIGQRALLVQTPQGNVLWDCVSLIDEETVEAVRSLGGVSHIAVSHPHMFGAMLQWSHALGDAPIYLHQSLEEWVPRTDAVINYWRKDFCQINDAVTLHRCGGHFEGSTVLSWSEGAAGRGVLLTSDTLHVARDRRHVSFMYSFPNYLPLSAEIVDEVVRRVEPLDFDRVYSHFEGLVIEHDARSAVRRSAQRYKQALRGHYPTHQRPVGALVA